MTTARQVAIAIAIALTPIATANTAAQDLVITNARVVDVTNGTVSEPTTVVVEGGRITVIAEDAANLPEGAATVDLMGRYLAPGLLDAHVHVSSIADARRALLSGVTTMRSMGTSHYVDVGMRELQAAGYLDAPQYLAAGYHVRPPAAEAFFQDHPELGHLYGQDVRGEEAVRAMTRAIVSRGVDFVKTNATERAGLPDTDPRRQFYSEAELRAIVEEARTAGIPVAAHAHGDAGARAAVEAGVRSIEHGTYISPETLATMVEMGTYLVPTIAIVSDLTIPGGDYDNAVLNIRGRHMLPRVREMARSAHEMGVKIVAATDTGYGPESTTTLAHELIEFAGIGMTPLEALRSATTTAAELFGLEGRVGAIAPGLEADLIVLEHNPLDDIAVVQDVLMVVSDGRVVVQRGDWPGQRPVS
ncbi:MAG: amidohydrolase family protein [Gemmatimonadota bacterium]|nr:amidohydrolase family protein [Gemmatimonadota bacterium]MDE2865731.1 amidohydrolase family protein [Gemmatimonadota bacterium]MYB07756.1 amidohydrolase family protein [Gemmatimonadota bacterium]MYG21153.1 amidohydrolase family protein [Gemmatimonadota bacterium]MYJ37623.1 amidohydrolase family protein [Gemmatimonadota bacterium]